jgi:hypothetical protein
MAAIISAVVVSVGAAIGATALVGLGTIAGISVGGLIGAGIAGGLMSEMKGGDFWDGFGVSALGYGVFQGLSGPGEGASASMGGDGYGGTYDTSGSFTPEPSSFNAGAAPITSTGMGDVDLTGVSSAQGPGFNDLNTNTSYGFNNLQTDVPGGANRFGAPAYAAPDSPSIGAGTPLGDLNPTGSVAGSQAANTSGISIGGSNNSYVSPPGSNPYAVDTSMGMGTPRLDQFLGGDGGLQTPSESFNLGANNASSISAPSEMSQVEGFGSQNYDLHSGSGGSGGFGPTMGGSNMASTANASSGGLKGMFQQGDQWLGENLGLPKGSTLQLGMAGATSLYDMYNAQKLKDMAAGMQPMSYADYEAKFGNMKGYRAAGQALGKSGRTGALPVLLARQKANIGNQYTTNYLPNAQVQGWNANMSAQNAASAVPRNLSATLASLYRPTQQPVYNIYPRG